jgi:hypothetical protein
MSIKKYFLLVISFFTLVGVSARNADDLSATLKDSKTKEPIAFASVELLSTKDSILTSCITDSKGYFELSPPAKTTKIRIKFVGYKNMEITFKDKDLNVIYLEEDTKQLNEVVVKGSARQNKVDRDIFTITKDLRAGTTTSQELLGKLNGVNFNQYDKSISVNGSTKVLLLIDGVEKDQQMTKTLSPERVDRVEVIKDPVGKYATDGYSAVINIILKKNYTGVDFYVGNTTFFDIVGTNGSSVVAQDYGNLNFTYTNKKTNLYFTSFGYGSSFEIPLETEKRYGNITTVSDPMDSYHPNGITRNRNGNASIGGDYMIDKNNTVSAEINWSGNKNDDKFLSNLTNYSNGTMLSSSSSQILSNGHNRAFNTTLTYNGKIGDKSTITSDFRYGFSDGLSNDTYLQDDFSSLSNIGKSGNFLRFNAGYTYQLASNLSAELGYGLRSQDNTSTMMSNSFTYNEFRNRASLYFSYQPLAKLRLKTGGIFETYHQTYRGASKDVSVFLPYLNVQYIPSQKFNMVAKYHTFANYTSMDQLTPFKTASDSLTWSIGNPDLKSSVLQTLGLEFHILNFLNIEPYYQFDNQRISSYISKVGKYYYVGNVNADLYERYGIKANFTLPLSKKLFWQNQLDFFRNNMKYNGEQTGVNSSVINSTLVYVDPAKGITMGAILQKQIAKSASIQGYSENGNDLVVLMLRKSFLKQRLNMTLFYIPPIKMGLKYTQDNEAKTTDYYNRSSAGLNLIKNLIFFEINYHFNSGKEVKQRQSTTDSDAVQSKSGIGI